MTFGVLRPVILLPPDSRVWDRRELRCALIHELEHVRRRDWLVHCASRITCAVYWFHPLVWVMRRQLALEAERACDDAVLRESEATQYAGQLVELAERLCSQRCAPFLAMAGRDELGARVSALLDSSLPRGRAGIAGLAAAAVIVLVAGAIAPFGVSAFSLPGGIESRVPQGPPAVALPDSLAFEEAARVAAPVEVADPQGPVSVETGAAFEAASIKINMTGGPLGQVNLNLPGGRVTARNTRLRLLIAAAYQPGFAPRRSAMSLIGLPPWDESLGLDVDAVAPGNPSPDQKRRMLQALLAERFGLVLHPETRRGPIFELMMDGKVGSQLTPHSPASACMDPSTPLAPPPTAVPAPPPLPPPCGGIRVQAAYWGSSMTTRMSGNGVTLQALAERLTWFQDVDRAVIDKTGLAGAFDFAAEWTPAVQLPPPAGADLTGLPVSDKPGQVTALREQLGLRLQPAEGPVEVLVIERVERPTEN
jgi:uncharacterized protein (TIGR03435 family)